MQHLVYTGSVAKYIYFDKTVIRTSVVFIDYSNIHATEIKMLLRVQFVL